jgi:hypothetical protein
MRAPREFRDPQGEGWTMAATEVVEDTDPATAKGERNRCASDASMEEWR